MKGHVWCLCSFTAHQSKLGADFEFASIARSNFRVNFKRIREVACSWRQMRPMMCSIPCSSLKLSMESHPHKNIIYEWLYVN